MSTTENDGKVDPIGVDLIDAGLFTEGPPHELFARMREECPVRWNENEDWGGFWSLTRSKDIEHVSKTSSDFSSWEKGVFLQPDQVAPLDFVRAVLLYKDPPEHTKFRKILNTAFVPNKVAKLEPDVRRIVSETIDAVIERGSCDFVDDIAVPVPLRVLVDLMGLPEEDLPKLRVWTDDIEAGQRSKEPAAATETFMEMSLYLDEQIERQTEEGNSESLVMRLRAAEVDGEKLPDDELLTFFGLLVFAGNDTTRNTIANGMNALLDHPDQLQLLRDDPSLIPQAVEEILRWTSVVNYFIRTAKTDTEVGGQAIAEGDRLLMWYTSASRDEEVVDDPTRFDVTRKEVAHKAFGGGGRHFCLGAGLARLELRVMLEEFVKRLDGLERDGEPEVLASSWANMLHHLPIRFTPGEKVAS